MITHGIIDRVCIIITVLAVLVTALFVLIADSITRSSKQFRRSFRNRDSFFHNYEKSVKQKMSYLFFYLVLITVVDTGLHSSLHMLIMVPLITLRSVEMHRRRT